MYGSYVHSNEFLSTSFTNEYLPAHYPFSTSLGYSFFFVLIKSALNLNVSLLKFPRILVTDGILTASEP